VIEIYGLILVMVCESP